MKVAVVGAGIHGSSTALSLARRGHSVTVFEQFPLGHDRGSSHGDSRIVRRAYPDQFYTEIMGEGYPMWHELEKLSGKKLLYECGLLYFGDPASPNLQAVVSSLKSLGVKHQVYDHQDVGHVFQELILYKDEVSIFTPEAGWVHASLAIEVTQELARAQGVTFREERVVDLDPLRHSFDKVALCQGPWASQFINLPVLVTLQTFGYISGEHYGPVWIEEGPNSLYGFPSEPWGPGIKTGVHFKDVPFDPDEPFRDSVTGAVELIKDFAWRRFGYDLPSVKRAKGCLYTNTSNEDFIFGSLDDEVLYVSACSGHGFKFGPWIGKTVADLVDGSKNLADFPRFSAGAARD